MKTWMRWGGRAGAALLGLAALLVLPQCLFFPESGFVGQPARNQAPMVKITGGVLMDSLDTQARVRFYWFGADNDGVIRWFEWAIDDTVSEAGWTRTTDYDAVISFEASTRRSGTDFSGWHTFYVRSVDNDYARSRADKRFFNANTIAPRTQIVKPAPYYGAQWASTLRITWLGEDPDGSRADKQPSAFEYKLILFEGSVNPGDLTGIRQRFATFPNQLLDSLRVQDYPDDPAYFAAARRAWIRVPGAVNYRWLRNLTPGRKYGFAVRAIDESGAVEPELGWHNWAIFDVQDRVIDVFLSEPSLGVRRFKSSVYDTWEVSVAPEQRIRFRWVGDASGSGTEAGPCNYGLNIPEPDEEIDKSVDGIGGWIGWAARTQMVQSIAFPRADEGMTHNFYFKMRAVSMMQETETKCHVAITVSRLSFNRRFLFVDDQRRAPRGCLFNTPKPDDGQSDALLVRLMNGVADYLPAGEQPGVYEAYGPRDESSSPALPQNQDFLSVLGTYQTVIWDMGTTGANLYSIVAERGDLSRYRGAGGNLLMLMDQGTIGPLVKNFQPGDPDPYCPATGLATTSLWNVFSFPYVHLWLRGCVDMPRNIYGDLAYRRMSMIGAKAEKSLYPDLYLDWSRWGCTNQGVWHYEALWPGTVDPTEIPWYEREAGLEILYRVRTFQSGSRLHDLPVAWRTFPTREDSLAGVSPGRAVVFNFHPWFFDEPSMTGAATLALRWLVTGSDL
ncbi:MAG: hypothetical protein FJY75_01315 [Candidatus Eisenbacteria bacterium]|uniref:Fibronectin type III domain-containing protein n=1 Tax=Eiseniibacteriota bacterium TaxID=2212470 RepID=A0A937X9S8_UNCEI|nr:hypothetical protein [Candidatus Eisenbacteria bacterium]